ncbi:C10 family peptidase, partial [bacterium]|nr:C10 family peptidase [bacterium]
RCGSLALAAFLILAIMPVDVLAERATTAEAELVCENWLARVAHERGGWAGASRPEILEATELLTDDGELLARCFSVSPRGHVVVPILKELPPVKVYSETSSFDAGATEGFVQLLRERLTAAHDLFKEVHGSLDARQSDREDDQLAFGRVHRRSWELLLVLPAEMRASLAKGEWPPFRDAGPLLTTSWHQFAPYNGFCPEGDGGRCLVGCVATAAAQIMNYHEWPPAGFGEFSYWWVGDYSCGGSSPGETLSAVFRDDYDWASMPEDGAHLDPGGGLGRGLNGGPSGRDAAAVAELCYEVGVSVGMWYGHCASGAGLPVQQLVDYFRYDDSIMWRHGRDYSSEDWFSLIQAEIDQSRPALYFFPQHALVCDGWRVVGEEMQIHLNYGGTGPYNAWYALDDIHGHDWDHRMEHMVVNIFPEPAIMLSADGSGDYASIQDAVDAVDAAAPGMLIKLHDGTYSGPGNRDIDFGGKAVTVRSHHRDPQTCVVDAGGSESDPHRGVLFTSSETSETVLQDVWLTGAWTADGGGGVYCLDASPTITGCVIEGNTAQSGGGGVLCAGTEFSVGTPLIIGCTIYGNEGGGILVQGRDAAIENTLIAGNTGGAAVSCQLEGEPLLTCCDIYGNQDGDWVGCIESQFGADGNICVGPVFCAPWDTVLTLSAVSRCVPANNACGVQIGALGEGCEDYVVYPDGSGYFETIQAAIDSVTGNDRPYYANSIVLADGVFTGPGNRDIECGASVRVYSGSGNAEGCVVDCSGDGEPHRGFSFHGEAGGVCKVDSITIVNASAPSGAGAAVSCRDGSVVWIRGCRLNDNSALRGGAVAADSGSTVFLGLCELSGNTASRGGAVYCADSSSIWIWGSTLVGNSADEGSGAYVSDAFLRLQGSIVAFGTEGGAVWSDDDSLDFYCSDIYGNEGGDWVGSLESFLGVDDNVSVDPLFCDPSGGRYSLAENSPCLEPGICVPVPMDQIGAHGVGCESADPHVPPGVLRLSQNYPNPFSPATDFTLVLPASGNVRLVVYDLRGRVVATVLDEHSPSGELTSRWDGRNDNGQPVAAGVYFARLEQAGRSDVRKIVVVR